MSSICVGCGLCCDGTLFLHVPLQAADDESVLATLGLTIKPRGDERVFAQPCVASCDGACSIYEDRPTVCRGYRCALLAQQESGTVSATEARRHIATAIQLRDDVTAGLDRLLPSSAGLALGARYPLLAPLMQTTATGDRRSANADVDVVMLDVATLRVHLTQHFDLDLDETGTPVGHEVGAVDREPPAPAVPDGRDA